ncbi:MAG: hypothetical protein ACE5ER_08950 [Nitrospinaceae bacterium]
MKLGKVIGIGILVVGLWVPGLAGAAEIVFGKNLKPGMSLEAAIQLLGIPKKVAVRRGPDPGEDSVEINYPSKGVLIRALTKGQRVEAIELSSAFKGRFANGLRMGNKFKKIVALYGVPKVLSRQVVKYPDRGLYFLLSKETLLSAKAFMKNTRLPQKKLMNH